MSLGCVIIRPKPPPSACAGVMLRHSDAGAPTDVRPGGGIGGKPRGLAGGRDQSLITLGRLCA